MDFKIPEQYIRTIVGNCLIDDIFSLLVKGANLQAKKELQMGDVVEWISLILLELPRWMVYESHKK